MLRSFMIANTALFFVSLRMMLACSSDSTPVSEDDAAVPSQDASTFADTLPNADAGELSDGHPSTHDGGSLSDASADASTSDAWPGECWCPGTGFYTTWAGPCEKLQQFAYKCAGDATFLEECRGADGPIYDASACSPLASESVVNDAGSSVFSLCCYLL